MPYWQCQRQWLLLALRFVDWWSNFCSVPFWILTLHQPRFFPTPNSPTTRKPARTSVFKKKKILFWFCHCLLKASIFCFFILFGFSVFLFRSLFFTLFSVWINGGKAVKCFFSSLACCSWHCQVFKTQFPFNRANKGISQV